MPAGRPADGSQVTDPYAHRGGSIRELADDAVLLAVGEEAREEDLEPLFEALRPLLEARAPAKLLVDASRLAATPLRVRWQVLRNMRAQRSLVARTAVFGLSERLETLLWIALGVSRRRNLRTFLWRHEAETWLAGRRLP